MRVGVRIKFNSPAILVFVALCFGALVANNLTGGGLNSLLFSTYHSSLSDPLTYVRFFTHVLGHGSWEHLIANMMYILLLGPLLEERYSGKMIVFVILITALATGLINYIFFPGVALCGASGVCFAFILMASFTGFKGGQIPVTFILVAVLFLGQEIYNGIILSDNVSQMAHMIGGIIGSVIGYKLNRH